MPARKRSSSRNTHTTSFRRKRIPSKPPLTREKRNKILAFLCILLLVAGTQASTYPRIHALLTFLRYIKLPTQPRTSKRRYRSLCAPREKLNWEFIDIYDDTGLFGDDFETILEEITPLFQKDRKRLRKSSLTDRERLYLALHWLRNYPSLREYKKIMGISVTTAWKEIHYVIPKLYATLRKRKTRIHLPKDWDKRSYNFRGILIHGAIDCTTHFRRRIHPGQALLYRGDKKGFFLSAQVLCSVYGDRIFSVDLGLGHNNDQGVFKRTLKTLTERNNLRFLADLGYRHCFLIGPKNKSDPTWRVEQSALRSVVEVVCGLSQCYAVCSGKFRGSVEFQEVCLMCVWEMVNINLRQFPLGIRHSYMLK